MTASEIVRRRLHNQHIARTKFSKPEEVVAWLGAVQAQDYAGAKWAVAQRAEGITDEDMEKAFAEGKILRTHMLRPTWHFVTPADIRWMITLTAPRVKAATAHRHRWLELDDPIIKRTNITLAKALQGGKHLTRQELKPVLEKAGIDAVDLRFSHIIMRAELDMVVCSGGKRGNQLTYALFEERVPHSKALLREEALYELSRRYFMSRGPATLQDFVWWSGLTVADARTGIETAKSELDQDIVNGKTFWFFPSASPAGGKSQKAYLLPNYDEYIVGYTDRSAIFDSAHTNRLDSRGNALFMNTIIIGGKVVGTWRRALKKNTIVITTEPFIPLTAAQSRALTAAAENYGGYMGISVILT